jgi:hypothetical protein
MTTFVGVIGWVKMSSLQILACYWGCVTNLSGIGQTILTQSDYWFEFPPHSLIFKAGHFLYSMTQVQLSSLCKFLDQRIDLNLLHNFFHQICIKYG